MFAPIRALTSVRPRATPALLVAASSVALHFAATPFLIPVVADSYGVSLGTAGLLSVTQVGGFTVANVVAGRRLAPRRRILVGAAVAGIGANVASALTGSFAVLIGLRALAGVAAGLVTWLAWTEAMRDRGALQDVSGVGPLTALIGSPVVAWLIAVGDERAAFIAMAISCFPAAFMRTSFPGNLVPAGRRRMSPSRSNVVLMVALGVLTAASSSLFIFAASIGEARVSLDPVAVSLAFSVNAGAGLVATRRRDFSDRPSTWLVVIAVCAAAVSFSTHPIVFFGAMAVWGYAFWRAVPVVLQQVAAWSLVPEERTGDAQGIMAMGRVAGPGIGGLLLSLGSFTAVGVETVAGVLVAAVTVALVGRYRRTHPERRPLTADLIVRSQ